MVIQIVSHQLVYRKIITFFNTSGYFNWWLIANVFSGHLYGNFSSTGGGGAVYMHVSSLREI